MDLDNMVARKCQRKNKLQHNNFFYDTTLFPQQLLKTWRHNTTAVYVTQCRCDPEVVTVNQSYSYVWFVYIDN